MMSLSPIALCVLFSMVQCSSSYFVFPASYRKYLDENRALFRPSAPLPRITSFLPPAVLVQEESSEEPIPVLKPLPDAVPRRSLRQFNDETHAMKRMRPCFYSPIQCLMKKKRAGLEESKEE